MRRGGFTGEEEEECDGEMAEGWMGGDTHEVVQMRGDDCRGEDERGGREGWRGRGGERE